MWMSCGLEKDFQAACNSYIMFENLVGLSFAPEKFTFPTTCIEWLGFLVDTKTMEVRIPHDKMTEIIRLCDYWLVRDRAKKRRVQSLIGKVLHASKCVQHGQPYR